MKHDKKEEKGLFRISYCSNKCKFKGPRIKSVFGQKTKEKKVKGKNNSLVEEMALLSIILDRELNKMPPITRLVVVADEEFSLLSEKLSFLEKKTSSKWSANKFYYHLNKRSTYV